MKISEGYMPFMGHHTYYRTVGERTDKAPLILMHGGPGSTHNYFEVLDRVAEEDGRMLVMYDQIGCGNSYVDGRPELWKAETWVNELIALREHLGLDTVGDFRHDLRSLSMSKRFTPGEAISLWPLQEYSFTQARTLP